MTGGYQQNALERLADQNGFFMEVDEMKTCPYCGVEFKPKLYRIRGDDLYTSSDYCSKMCKKLHKEELRDGP